MTTLHEAIAVLQELAPPRLAQGWDNTGLLLEPPIPRAVDAALLCIDLTEPVLDEALARGASLVVAYHPLIFAGWKRLRMTDPGPRVALRAAVAGVGVYSPHTALDAAPGGMGDWLAATCGPLSSARPIQEVEPGAGPGRLATLAAPAPLEAVVERVRVALGLTHLRVADAGRPIVTVASCPGAGGSVFEGLDGVDLLLTGELRHHDVLAWKARGTSVILTDHSNTERGFLSHFAAKLRQALPAVAWHVSQADRDPLEVR